MSPTPPLTVAYLDAVQDKGMQTKGGQGAEIREGGVEVSHQR